MDKAAPSARNTFPATYETIAPADVRRLRAGVYADGIVSREEAEVLFAINRAAKVDCREWRDFLIEAVSDLLVHQEKPIGYVSDQNAEWLVGVVARNGVVETMTELELVITVLEKARSSPEKLVSFALAQVAGAVIEGSGPLARVPGRLPNVVEKDEVDLLRRILYAFGGDRNIAISRAEAEVLLSINDRTVEEMNDPSWNELFVKAMTNFAMCSSGYVAPTREEALRHDSFFDRAEPDLGTFFSRMVSGGVSGILDAYANPVDSEADWEARNRSAEADRRRAEAIDAEEANWLANRIGKDRLLHENERALLSFIKKSASSVHPALKPLVDKVA